MILQLQSFHTNDMYRGRRYKTNEYKKWLLDGQWLLKGHSQVSGEVEVSIRCWTRNYARSDADGFLKPICDLLTTAKIIDDDRFIKKLTVEKFKSDEERYEISIKSWAEDKSLDSL